MNTIPYDYAVQLLQHREQHLQWVEKMQLQGDLALIAGDFAAYAKNTKRLLNNPLSTSAGLQKEDTMSIDVSAVTLPPVTCVSECYDITENIIDAAYEKGCIRALPLVLRHNNESRLPYYNSSDISENRKGMTEIDFLLEKGGNRCYEMAKAKSTEPDYMVLLGICYMRGVGIECNYEKALKCFLSVVNQSALAQFCIGICYEKGYDVPQDIQKAGRWYYLSAKNGCWQAAEVLFNRSEDFVKDKPIRIEQASAYEEQWLELLEKYADMNSSEALRRLAELNGLDTNVRCDLLQKAALLGYTDAQVKLADRLYGPDGEGCYPTKEECANALKWYRSASRKGNPHATYCVGLMYMHIHGKECVVRDFDKALYWFKKAAELDSDEAQNELGNIYRDGDDVEENLIEAVKWYRKAAEQGYAEAQYNLGRCYDFGWGVAEDKAEAEQWYRKAAEQGDEDAKEALEMFE